MAYYHQIKILISFSVGKDRISKFFFDDATKTNWNS